MHHLARGDQFTKSGERLLHGGHRVGAVLVVQIDAIRAEAFEAHLTPVKDAPAQQPGPVGLFGRAGGELGGYDHRVAPRAQSLAEEHLGPTIAVTLGGVEMGDPRIKGGADHPLRLGLVDPATEVVAAQPHHGQFGPIGPKPSGLHKTSSPIAW